MDDFRKGNLCNLQKRINILVKMYYNKRWLEGESSTKGVFIELVCIHFLWIHVQQKSISPYGSG
ncbi:hypothetical protein ATY39_09270 [Rummeliibacillus stabekisii]|uniref:Uncharacterized protein n=1 Tax=Rummeliibacillus stabekisii TaxID=241244 RepID=A0A143HD28_9BACL|nr:hypothetical protein ATY39_09270 [Rummeliibacillus stabekisii]